MPTTHIAYRDVYFAIAVASMMAAVLLAITDADAANPLSGRTAANPIKQYEPVYPSAEYRRGREAWVQISFVVTEDGKTIDHVIERSYGGQRFEDAALRAVKLWQYEPATWNGKPAEQARTSSVVTFGLGGQRVKPSGSFLERISRITELLDRGKLERANSLISKTFNEWNMSLYELARLWTVRARYEGISANKKGQLSALRYAMINNGKWLDKNTYESLLLVTFAVGLELGNISNALDDYETLVELGGKRRKELAKLATIVESLRQIIASDALIEIPGDIERSGSCEECDGNWRYRLLRREFSLANVRGELSNLEISCDLKRLRTGALVETYWKIPRNWGHCRVLVFGRPGTTFDLLEWPEADGD